MFRRLVLVMGEPGTGKTTMMRLFIATLGNPGMVVQNNLDAQGKHLNYAKATVYPERKVVLFGVYDGNLYDGTDRLGRNVQPCAEVLLRQLNTWERFDGYTIVMEGDRLTTPTFLTAVEALMPVTLIQLHVGEPILAERRARRALEDAEWVKTANPKVAGKPRREGRNTGQESSWLAGRKSKLNNIAQSWPTVHLAHETAGDMRYVLHILQHYAGTCTCDDVSLGAYRWEGPVNA